MQRLIPLFCLLILLWSCKYNRGEIYRSMVPGDSLHYVISAKGLGAKLMNKASILKIQHEVKGNSCEIRYLGDSVRLLEQKGVLLVHTVLPDIKKDMLSKGYLGTLSSKQSVTYLLVTYDELKQYFRKKEE
jgi:hypothetical protein